MNMYVKKTLLNDLLKYQIFKMTDSNEWQKWAIEMYAHIWIVYILLGSFLFLFV